MSFFSLLCLSLFSKFSMITRHHFVKEKKLNYKISLSLFFLCLVCISCDIGQCFSSCADIVLDSVKEKDKCELAKGICGNI